MQKYSHNASRLLEENMAETRGCANPNTRTPRKCLCSQAELREEKNIIRPRNSRNTGLQISATDCDEGTCQTEVRASAVSCIVDLAPRLCVTIGLVLGVDPTADHAVERRRMALCD